MIKAVIDTNVIVSAYITKNLESATFKVWEAVMQCKLMPVYNAEILYEYSEVLHRKKFGIPRGFKVAFCDLEACNSARASLGGHR